MNVTNGIPQVSVLGPVLFNIFINNLEWDVTSEIAKFPDDIKLFRLVKNNKGL